MSKHTHLNKTVLWEFLSDKHAEVVKGGYSNNINYAANKDFYISLGMWCNTTKTKVYGMN